MVTIQDNCTGCGACIRDCVSGVLSLEAGRAVVRGACIQCGHCVAICPVGAPSIPEYGMEDVEPLDKTEPIGIDVLLRAIKGRRSIRQYQARAVEQDVLERIVQAGRYTATAVNRQDCRFIVVQERLEEFKKLIWDGIGELLSLPEEEAPPAISRYKLMYAQKQRDPSADFLFRNAPAVVFVTCERLLDSGLAAQNMELAALAQGLGMLYNGYLVRAAAAIPGVAGWLGADQRPLAACMLLGYPAVSYRRTAPRRAADAVWR